MRKIVFGINISADGYCGHEGMVADAELHRYFTRYLENTDTILLGRKTYDLMVPFWPDVVKTPSEEESLNEFARAFDSQNLVVFSTTMQTASEKSRIVREDLKGEALRLKEQSGKCISAGSLSIASQLSEFGLIDEYHFVVHPVIAGKGPRLFESLSLPESLRLQLIGSETFVSGAIASHYRTSIDPR
ncbi:MAG: dihydrofolate reductase family protein [Leptospiraceae bacterium]|nr:dihydrofolate reductase family protein [Leptospiraceae bacterium]